MSCFFQLFATWRRRFGPLEVVKSRIRSPIGCFFSLFSPKRLRPALPLRILACCLPLRVSKARLRGSIQCCFSHFILGPLRSGLPLRLTACIYRKSLSRECNGQSGASAPFPATRVDIVLPCFRRSPSSAPWAFSISTALCLLTAIPSSLRHTPLPAHTAPPLLTAVPVTAKLSSDLSRPGSRVLPSCSTVGRYKSPLLHSTWKPRWSLGVERNSFRYMKPGWVVD